VKRVLGTLAILAVVSVSVAAARFTTLPSDPIFTVASLPAKVVGPARVAAATESRPELLRGPFVTAWADASLEKVPLYSAPGGPTLKVLSNPDHPTLSLTFLGLGPPVDGWLEVYVPVRPNGSKGFVRTEGLHIEQTNFQIQIEKAAHRLTLYDGDKSVLTTAVVIGKANTPTPVGLFYLQGKLRLASADGVYGPFILPISAHSDVLKTFGGGDGHVAIHGTNQPGLIGQDVSNGCIRVKNDVILKLAAIAPIGTPVVITS
jgi:hypothetical protein